MTGETAASAADSRNPRPRMVASPPAAESQGKSRRSRRHADDDFGDFTYLHDPGETEPGIPGSRGRRAM